MHSEIKEETASNETFFDDDAYNRCNIMETKGQFKLPFPAKTRLSDYEISNWCPQERTNRRKSSSSSGVSSMGGLTPDVEKVSLVQLRGESLPSDHRSSLEETKTDDSDRNEAKSDRLAKRRSTFSSFGSGSLEESNVVDGEVVQKEKKRKRETSKLK